MSTVDSIERRVTRYAKRHAGATFRKARGIGVLAEGDSWFTWPMHPWEGKTVVAALEARRKGERPIAAVSVANPGALIATMATKHNEDLALACHAPWLANKARYDAVLLSAGGNDLLDDATLRVVLPHPNLHVPGGNYLHGFLDVAAFETVLTAIMDAYAWLFANLPDYVFALPAELAAPARRLPVVVHGYAEAIPTQDARRFLGLVQIGPWLGRRMASIGVPTATQRKIARDIVAGFNTRLAALATATNAAPNARVDVHYVDLRPLIDEDDFDDEIHLKQAAIRRVANRIAEVLYLALP